MIKRILPVALLSAFMIGNTSCKNEGGFKKLNGIEYKIIKDVPGKNAQVGDIVEYHIIAKADTFNLGDSRKQNNGNPAMVRVEDVKKSGQFQAVFTVLSAGDSALVEISCDTLMKSIPANQLQQAMQSSPWLKKGNKVKVSIAIVSVKSMDDYKKEQEAKKMVQAQTDDKLIQDYIAKNNIKAQKTASGVYYAITKDGTGTQVTKGLSVSMKYTGKNLAGKTFDTNTDSSFHHMEPLTFTVGAGQMIPGMDEAAALLKKGSKATIFIPSPLGYGPQAIGPDVPANSVLVFDVEVIDVKTAPAPSQGPGQGMGEEPMPSK